MAPVSARARLIAWIATGVVGGGLVAAAAVSQLGTATAATPSPRPSAPQPDADGRWAPPFGHMPGGPLLWPGFAMGGRVLHGEATVKTADGVEVVSTQTGTLSSVAGSTVTVTSSDGFARDYVVDKDTRISLNGTDGALSSLKDGDSVHVMAVKDGGAYHAQSVVDGVPPHPMLERFRMHRGT